MGGKRQVREQSGAQPAQCMLSEERIFSNDTKKTFMKSWLRSPQTVETGAPPSSHKYKTLDRCHGAAGFTQRPQHSRSRSGPYQPRRRCRSYPTPRYPRHRYRYRYTTKHWRQMPQIGWSVPRTHPNPTRASALLAQRAADSSRQANHDCSSGLTAARNEPRCTPSA